MNFLKSIMSFFGPKSSFKEGDLVRIDLGSFQDEPYTVLEVYSMADRWKVAHVIRAGSTTIDIIDVDHLRLWEDAQA